MPLTGFEPTIAIAFAATVVNRKEMMPAMSTADQRLPDVFHDSAQCEECENRQEGYDNAEDNAFHRHVFIGAVAGFDFGARLFGELAGCKSDCRFYDAERFDDAYDAGCRNAADTDVSCVFLENLVCGHVSYGLCDAGVHEVNDLSAPDDVH